MLERDRKPALPKYLDGGADSAAIGEIRYRCYKPGDEVSILEGFNETFGLDRSLEYWRWKFADPDFGRFMSVAVGRSDRVLAFYGAMPLDWQFDGARKLAGLGADVYCRRHPELIRRNVFMNTFFHFVEHQLGSERLAIVFGFAGHTASRLYKHRTDCFGPLPIELYERLDGAAARAVAASGIPAASGSVLRGADAVAALDELWPRVSQCHARIAVRDAAWARRRFVDRPDEEYRCVTLLDAAGHPESWGAFRFDGGVFYVCDMMWAGGGASFERLDALFRAEAATAGAARSLTVLHNAPEIAAHMAAAGWERTIFPHGGSWVMQSGDPAIGRDILDSFYLTFADTDLV